MLSTFRSMILAQKQFD